MINSNIFAYQDTRCCVLCTIIKAVILSLKLINWNVCSVLPLDQLTANTSVVLVTVTRLHCYDIITVLSNNICIFEASF